MSPKKNAQVYTILLNEGPQARKKLPHSPTIEQRADGVQKFKPSGAYVGGTQQGGGFRYPVYYIEGKHNPESVIREFIDTNQKVMEEASKWSLHHLIAKYGEEFKKASREILGPFDVHRENPSGGKGGTCPLCGATFDGNLPDHLPCDE